MKPPSVCFVCHEYPPAPHGGIGTFTQMVGQALVRTGWEVRVVGLHRDVETSDGEEDGGVRVYRLALPKWDKASLRARYLLYRTVAGWSRRGEIDLVELPDAQGWCAGWPSLPVPVVIRVHGSVTYFARELGRRLSRLNYALERSAMRRADFWCAVSRYAAEKTQAAFGLRPADAISNVPIAPPALNGTPRSRRMVIYSGTLTAKKGIVQLVRAWPGVLSRVPDAELHVFGKDGAHAGGSMRQHLLGLLDPAARGSVVFHGHCERPVLLSALERARLAVFPSYAEAFAFAPMEAMACGCPTVYSQRTSGRELIQDNRQGILIDPDDVAGITGATVSLLEDDALASRVGYAGRQHVLRNYGVDTIAGRIGEFYRECVAPFGPSRAGAEAATPAPRHVCERNRP